MKIDTTATILQVSQPQAASAGTGTTSAGFDFASLLSGMLGSSLPAGKSAPPAEGAPTLADVRDQVAQSLQTWQQNGEAVITRLQGLAQERLAEIRSQQGDARVPDTIVRGSEILKAYMASRWMCEGQPTASNLAIQSGPDTPPEYTLPTDDSDQPADATVATTVIPIAFVAPAPAPQIPVTTDAVDATTSKPNGEPVASPPSLQNPPVADPAVQRQLTGTHEPGEKHSDSVAPQVRSDLWKARLPSQKSPDAEAFTQHNGAPDAVNHACDAATADPLPSATPSDVSTATTSDATSTNQASKSVVEQPAAAFDKPQTLPTSFVSDPRPDRGRLQIELKSHLTNVSGDATNKVNLSGKAESSVSRREIAHSVRSIESAFVTGTTGPAKVEAVDLPEQKTYDDSDTAPAIDSATKADVGDATHLHEGSPVETNHGPSVEANHLDRVPLRSLPEHVQAIVTRHLEHSDSDRSTSVVLRLDPPSLGRVEVHVTQSGDTLSIRMVTSGEAARDVIERQLTELESSLTDRGVQFDKCQVECNSFGQHTFDRSFRQPSTQPEEAYFPTRRVATPDATTRPWQGRTGLDYVA